MREFLSETMAVLKLNFDLLLIDFSSFFVSSKMAFVEEEQISFFGSFFAILDLIASGEFLRVAILLRKLFPMIVFFVLTSFTAVLEIREELISLDLKEGNIIK